MYELDLGGDRISVSAGKEWREGFIEGSLSRPGQACSLAQPPFRSLRLCSR